MGDGDLIQTIRDELFVVHYDGTVIGNVRRTHKSYCAVQPQYYPYDTGLTIIVYNLEAVY